MFTGIVEELGTVAGVEDQGDAMRLTIHAEHVLADAGLGDSISVNGCCLTVAERDGDTWTADVMQETLDKTSLAGVQPGDRVNLERAVTPTTRLGGHIVQGHVDGVGTIASRTPSEHWEVVDVSMPSELARYLVDKGSITVDGVSLTVVEARDDGFTVSLIPETLARTTLGSRQAGDRVNLEVDVLAKHVEKLLAAQATDGKDDVMTEPQHVGVRMDSIERAVADIAAGKAVVVVDDESRENEGDLIFAASKATPDLMAFTIRYSSGVICVPMPGTMLDRLEIPLMTPHNKDRMRTAYTISVDARDGVTTGISAADRAHTVRVLADSATEPWEITRPGHVFPLRYRDGGVLARRGHTEAAVDLARLAGLTPAGVLVELVNDDGSMKRAPELREFADEHGLAMISIEDLVRWRRRNEVLVDRVAETRLPTSHGDFTAYGYQISVDDSEHVALVYGDISGPEPVLTRVHSECLTGDVFNSDRCDCGPQLNEAMDTIVTEGRGVVVYLRGHEGRGIGLVAKLQAYQLQDGGRDTVDANLDLGLPADARHYGAATQILKDLGVSTVRLMTNNPDKVTNLQEYGITVAERVPLTPHPNDHNLAYLLTKRDRMGHVLPDLEALDPAEAHQ